MGSGKTGNRGLSPITLTKHPASFELADRAAFVALSKGNIALAEKQASELVRKHPTYASPYLTLSMIATQRGQWANALEYDRKAYELSGNRLVLLSVASELHQLGRHEEAVSTVYRVLQEDPALAARRVGINEAIYSLGALGRLDEAKQLVRRRMSADQDWRQDATLVQAAKRLKIEQ